MNKYYCAVWDNSFKKSFVECPNAKPVVIPGFEEYQFFIHRPPIQDTGWKDKNWNISEATTGLLILGDVRTRAEAKELATDRLNHAGKEELNRCIASADKCPFVSENNNKENSNE